MKKRILTGITTTGTPHIGNYIGAIRPALDLAKDSNDSFFFLADYHSIIKNQNSDEISASVKNIAFEDKTWIIKLMLKDKSLYRLLIEKASITVNGVSLTISKVSKKYFEINVIPHTLKLTNLKNLKTSDVVNIELDIFGKYALKFSK